MRDDTFRNNFDARRANDAYITVVEFISSLPPGQDVEKLKKVRESLEVLRDEIIDHETLKFQADQCKAVMDAMTAWGVINEGLSLKLHAIQKHEEDLGKLMCSEAVQSLKKQMENSLK